MVARSLIEDMEIPQIPQFYAGKNVLITGATGFMGKVLIERLLATCPDIGRIHLIMRKKKDNTPEKRLAQLKQSQVFDVLRRNNASQLDKLRAVDGDTSLPNLGMESHELAQIQEVSIIFHVAATLKFDEELKKAVDINLRSIMRLMDICDKLPKVDAFVHVSTAYCNAELSDVEEKVYPPPVPRHRLEAIVDNLDEQTRTEITGRLLGEKPNTYTFTKAMAENAVMEHKAKYPVAIFRPTVVISSVKNPVPGWIENLNGPSGVVVASGKGLMHVFRHRTDVKSDLLPVDIAIDTMIACGWDVATNKYPEPRVYNCSVGENPSTWTDFETALRAQLIARPMDKALWYPSGINCSNIHVYRLMKFLLQTLPLYLADCFARLFSISTPVNLRVASHKIGSMTEVLMFFMLREWKFSTDNVRALRRRLSPADAAIYNLDPNTIRWDDHYRDFVLGVRRYILHEKDQDLEEARRRIGKLYYLHTAMKMLFFVLTLRMILYSSSTARSLFYGSFRIFGSLFNAVFSKLTPAS